MAILIFWTTRPNRRIANQKPYMSFLASPSSNIKIIPNLIAQLEKVTISSLHTDFHFTFLDILFQEYQVVVLTFGLESISSGRVGYRLMFS